MHSGGVTLDPDAWRDVKILPLFLHDDGRILVPAARMIWDCLLEDRPRLNQLGYVAETETVSIFQRLRSEAERQGQLAFDELHARHNQRLKREQDKGQYAFQVRRDALNRIGLPEVSVSTASASWRKSSEPGRPSFASGIRSCLNSNRLPC